MLLFKVSEEIEQEHMENITIVFILVNSNIRRLEIKGFVR